MSPLICYSTLVISLTFMTIAQQTRSQVSEKGGQIYYYARARNHPKHLRVAEEFKNPYVEEIKYETSINGTKYEYYKSISTVATPSTPLPPTMNYDELVFETIDKMFRHRLAPYYIHHYDSDEDKRHSSDPAIVSQEACARDLLYLVEKLPKKFLYKDPFESLAQQPPTFNTNNYSVNQPQENEQLTPELTAFFDSYARQEAGLLMGNTYWVGAYDQCVSRQIFELSSDSSATSGTSSADKRRHATASAALSQENQQQQNKQQVVSFKGRYCVSSLKSPVWKKMIEAKKLKEKNYFRSEQQLKDYSKLFRLQLGICLPDSCDSTALERHFEEINLLTKAMLEPRYTDYDLIDLYCLPDESSSLRQLSSSALGCIAFMTIWLVLVVLATFADALEIFDLRDHYPVSEVETEGKIANAHDKEKVVIKKTRSSKLNQFICWFSLRANYKKLMHVSEGRTTTTTKTSTKNHDDKVQVENFPRACETPAGSVKQEDIKHQASVSDSAPVTEQHSNSLPEVQIDLRFLNAFKAIVMFWIINGHIMLLMIQTAKNILDSDAQLNGLMHFLIGATFGVDLFFTMTGFLTAYLLFNSGHAYQMKLSSWIYLSFHRYWRLAPLYLLTFWFSRSVMQSLGTGPLWDYGTSNITFRGLCNVESWWYPLTLTSNLHGLFDECMITSWYISCDMQFWLVSPVFIYLLAKSPAQGWLVTMLTILASSKMRYDSMLTSKSARYDELVEPRADIFMRVSHDLPELYTHPHYRISAYLVGLLAGHYVYMVKSHKWNSVLVSDLIERQAKVGDVNNGEVLAKASSSLSSSSPSLLPLASDKVREKCELSLLSAKENGQVEENQDDSGLKDTSINNCDKITSKTSSSFGNQNEPNKVVNSFSASTTATKTTTTRAHLCRRLRASLAYLGLSLFLVMAFCSFLLSHYYPQKFLKNAKQVAGILYSIDHLLMSIGASLIITTICLGQWSKVVKFLSHPNWTRLSKINYALLLLQCEAIYYQIFRYDQVPMSGTKELINILFNLLVTLYPLALLFTLAFEFPLANVEKLLLRNKTK